MSHPIPVPQRRALQALSAAYFVQATGALAIAGSLEPIAHQWALSESQSAFLLALFGLTFALAAPLSQVLFGHLPRRRQVLAGVTVFGLGAFLFAFAPGYPVLVTARIIMGLGASMMGPMLVALGSELVAQKDRGSAIAMVLLGLSVASMAGIPLAAWVASLWGAKVLFIAVGVASLLTVLMILLTVPGQHAGERVPLRAVSQMMTDARSLSVFMVVFFISAGVFATYAFISPLVRTRYHGDAEAVTVALFILGVAGIVGNLFVARAARRYSAERLLTAGIILLMAVVALLLVMPARLPLLYLALVLWAFATDILWPSQQRRVVELAPQQRGLALALTSAFMFCGIGAGSAVAAWIYPLAGVSGILFSSALLLGLALLTLWLSERVRARQATSLKVQAS
ncbi:MFS transporter [Nissabacter sp. SGAir0207]|uniref:MFS transporter n=1 Tax=Nissabacter sp. SGAir0207 TaxID=2126321 RepID=UPI0010CCD073|nr:MFS transporter [Nissabacter sp. SGAir0207]QCR36829.1 MFS transporter [Nissabacter sp. SGAir0207]